MYLLSVLLHIKRLNRSFFKENICTMILLLLFLQIISMRQSFCYRHVTLSTSLFLGFSFYYLHYWLTKLDQCPFSIPPENVIKFLFFCLKRVQKSNLGREWAKCVQLFVKLLKKLFKLKACIQVMSQDNFSMHNHLRKIRSDPFLFQVPFYSSTV